jgi:hypothetical protein
MRDFSETPHHLRAAIEMAFAPDVTFDLDTGGNVQAVNVWTPAGELWLASQPVPIGRSFDDVRASMHGLTVETLCL